MSACTDCEELAHVHNNIPFVLGRDQVDTGSRFGNCRHRQLHTMANMSIRQMLRLDNVSNQSIVDVMPTELPHRDPRCSFFRRFDDDEPPCRFLESPHESNDDDHPWSVQLEYASILCRREWQSWVRQSPTANEQG